MIHLKFTRTTALFLLIGLVFHSAWSQNKALEGKKILIYTKNGKGYVHENIATSVETLQNICDEIGVESVVSEDPAIFTSAQMMTFDAVFFSNTNNEAFDNEEQRTAFQNFCKSGKSFGGLHSAIGS